jgi:hypothetical protein
MSLSQRPIAVLPAAQMQNGRWLIPVRMYEPEHHGEVFLTPLQAVRIASDLLAAWRAHELKMKNPRTDEP